MIRVIAAAALLCACHQSEPGKDKEKPRSNATVAADSSGAVAAGAPAAGAPAAPAAPAAREPDTEEAYLRDIERFCFAEKHAGALEIETTARSLVVADWLGRNLETVRARDFLISLQTLPAAEKAKRFRAEGAKASLSDCPTAAAWEALSEASAP